MLITLRMSSTGSFNADHKLKDEATSAGLATRVTHAYRRFVDRIDNFPFLVPLELGITSLAEEQKSFIVFDSS